MFVCRTPALCLRLPCALAPPPLLQCQATVHDLAQGVGATVQWRGRDRGDVGDRATDSQRSIITLRMMKSIEPPLLSQCRFPSVVCQGMSGHWQRP